MSHIAPLTKAFFPVHATPKVMTDMSRLGRQVLALPFDMAREQYAKSVRAGLVERSMIASARMEHAISAMEVMSLGYMARRY